MTQVSRQSSVGRVPTQDQIDLIRHLLQKAVDADEVARHFNISPAEASSRLDSLVEFGWARRHPLLDGAWYDLTLVGIAEATATVDSYIKRKRARRPQVPAVTVEEAP